MYLLYRSSSTIEGLNGQPALYTLLRCMWWKPVQDLWRIPSYYHKGPRGWVRGVSITPHLQGWRYSNTLWQHDQERHSLARRGSEEGWVGVTRQRKTSAGRLQASHNHPTSKSVECNNQVSTECTGCPRRRDFDHPEGTKESAWHSRWYLV